MDRKKHVREVLRLLRKEYTEPRTVLNFSNPFELLVATVLSAQTTDALVNRVTGPLFRKYRTVKDYAAAPVEEFRKDVRSVNFYNTKAKNILAAAGMVVERFNGRVPGTMEELVTLPGVARKTANIILWNAFGKNEGVAVDTHVKRLSQRLGLTGNDDPVKIEQDLMAVTPRDEWGNLSHLLICHGRKVCQAKKPLHRECVLFGICPSRDL